MKTKTAIITLLGVWSFCSACLADELHVPSEYATIQAAIDAALDGDVVLVADGTYTGGGHSGIDFRGKAITVRSENGPENCIIDSQNSHQGFRFTSGENQNSVLDGLTITNGYHGIYCKGSSPVIRNCNITGNPGGEHGGGIFCSSGSLTIENCTITGNSAGRGGGIYCSSGSLTINNCTISCNTADYDDGGGIYYRSSRDYDNTLTITNSIITANSARSEGGGIYCRNTGGTAEITNCAITGNSAGSSGAGIYCYTYGTAVFANCTIAGNSADYSSGGIYCTSRNSAEITNSILWDNSPRQITFYGHDSTISVAYSDVQDGPNGIYVGESSMLNWGEGNIDADPCFTEPGYWDAGAWVEGDYRLWDDSPCIDAGDPNHVTEPNETDLDGNPRVIGGRIDMGAYEYLPPVQAEMKLIPQSLNCAGGGKHIKAHITLPEGFLAEDVDVNEPALAEPVDVESEYIRILANETGPVKVEIGFDRQEFCERVAETGEMEVTVSGYLTTGQLFIATDTVKIDNRGGRR